MQVIKHNQKLTLNPTTSTIIHEFESDNPTISGAIAKIHGRYPKSGYAQNETFTEICYCLKGLGSITTPEKTYKFSKGDQILIPPGEKYYWSGNFEIYMATSPKFDPTLHSIVNI